MKKTFFLLTTILLVLIGWTFVNPKESQACGEKCYYDYDCDYPIEKCSGWNPKTCTCKSGYLCDNGTCQETHKECVNYSCQDVVGSGPDTCSDDCDCKCCDTDNGDNVWVKGTVTCPSSICYESSSEGTDYCLQGIAGKENWVMERWCQWDNLGAGDSRSCPALGAVCQNGRCVKTSSPTNTPAATPTSSWSPTNTPTPTSSWSPTNTPRPTSPPSCRSCNRYCWSNSQCCSGYCYNRRCRNQSCPTRSNCLCPPTPTPANQPPSCTSLSADTTSGDKPLTVQFTGSGSDSDGYINKYQWNFDGGGWDRTTNSNQTSYTYNTEDTYTARLRVRDNDGAWSGSPSSCRKTIEVTACVPNTCPAGYCGDFDNGCKTVSCDICSADEDCIDHQCYQPSFIKAYDADIHSQENINLPPPPPGQYLLEGHIGYGGIVSSRDPLSSFTFSQSNWVSRTDWPMTSDNDYMPYALLERQTPQDQGTCSGSACFAMSSGDKFYYRADGDVVTPGPLTIPSGKSFILLLGDKDITIRDNIVFEDETSFFMIAARGDPSGSDHGDITVGAKVTELEGVYYTENGTFTTKSDKDLSVPVFDSQTLFLRGNFVAEEFELNRDLGKDNKTTPAESFYFLPFLQFTTPSFLQVRYTIWQEMRP